MLINTRSTRSMRFSGYGGASSAITGSYLGLNLVNRMAGFYLLSRLLRLSNRGNLNRIGGISRQLIESQEGDRQPVNQSAAYCQPCGRVEGTVAILCVNPFFEDRENVTGFDRES